MMFYLTNCTAKTENLQSIFGLVSSENLSTLEI